MAPFIQDHIWRQGWTEIRSVQAAACAAILDTDDHVLITSGTASGKTEAALLPILTQLHGDPPSSIGVLYIGPLKALINDQFFRLEGLLADSGLPVEAWHGDVSAARKRRTLQRARGLLQITPESLEALLLRRANLLAQVFGDLRFVVIDEVHAFMADERGRQVLCLLERLERVIKSPPRRVGLSATLGDVGLAGAWLKAGTGRDVQVVQDTGGRRRLQLALEHFSSQKVEGDESSPPTEVPGLYEHLYAHTLDRKSLIFRNTRQGVEDTVVALRDLAQRGGTADLYHVHHGSVATAYREDAERAMKEEGVPACTVATVTLELGIDLGQLERVLQVDPPPSVSSFVQRLGRTGRRGEPGEMILYTLGREDPDAPPHRRLPWSLLQTVAMVQLYLEERWVEPARQPRLPFSLLVHQTLAALEQYGEQHPRELAARVLTLTPFQQVAHEQYRALLHHLLGTELIQRTDEGGLIVGLSGERLVADWRFYAVFPEVPEYPVFHGTSQIGTLSSLPEVGQVISLTGRAWRVTERDETRREVFVQRARGRNTSAWLGGGGEVHDRVVQKMREVLVGETHYPYLQPAAQRRLAEARHLAQTSGLLTGPLHPLSERQLLYLPWRGTRVHRSIGTLLAEVQTRFTVDHNDTPFSLVLNGTEAEVRAYLSTGLPDPGSLRTQLRQTLLASSTPLGDQKFDRFVPRPLLVEAHLGDDLDLVQALEDLRNLAP
nr:DEAD/DEAH box helicase [Deinococcus budaensis]